jgi:hypothetical protein
MLYNVNMQHKEKVTLVKKFISKNENIYGSPFGLNYISENQLKFVDICFCQTEKQSILIYQQ